MKLHFQENENINFTSYKLRNVMYRISKLKFKKCRIGKIDL